MPNMSLRQVDFNIDNFFGQGWWCLLIFLPIFNSHLLTIIYLYLCNQLQPLFLIHILAMFLAINAASIKAELVVDERPNEIEAHENDESNEDTYNYDDENNFFNNSRVHNL